MTNKEKLEIIDEQLEMLYEELADLENFTTDAQHNITQAIYNLESTKLLLEPIEKEDNCNYYAFTELTEKDTIDKIEDDSFCFSVNPTIYVCPKCKKEAIIYGDMVDGKCLKCNEKLVKKTQ